MHLVRVITATPTRASRALPRNFPALAVSVLIRSIRVDPRQGLFFLAN
jgi:hypothetical protein